VLAKNKSLPNKFWETRFKKAELGKYFVMFKDIKDTWVDTSLSPYKIELDAFKAALVFAQNNLFVKVVKREEIYRARKEIKETVLSL
jgi:hypothetical protein